ncbi:MAG: hypothetical protein LBN18_06280, partial [Dysgonamonadaceae bacterium]|nr:hypothetical protein [Dysgonamonadaceae bacterium]
MKKLLFLSCWLSALTVSAQPYIHCLDDGMMKWSFLDYHIDDAGLISTEIIAFGDTVINDLSYKKMYVTTFDYFKAEESNLFWKNWVPDLDLQSPWESLSWKNIFIRESDDASKLYIYDGNRQEEYMISDMDLQEGDIVSSYIGKYDDLVVDSVYWKDNKKHVRFNYNPIYLEALTFIEGAGPNVWLIYPYSYEGTLNCFQNQSVFYKKTYFWWGGDCPCGYVSPLGGINPIKQEQDYRLFIQKDHLEI